MPVSPIGATGTKHLVYTVGSPTAVATTATTATPVGCSQRVVVFKSGSGGLQAINASHLTPAVLDILKKEGINIATVRSTLLSQPSLSVTQPVTSFLPRSMLSATSLLSNASTNAGSTGMEATQTSEASEAAAALMSSMEEVETTESSTTSNVQMAQDKSDLDPATNILLPTATSTTIASSTLFPGATSLLATPGSSQPKSLLGSVLASDTLPKQHSVLKQAQSPASSRIISLAAQPGMRLQLGTTQYRIVSSQGKGIQMSPVPSTSMLNTGKRYVMLTPTPNKGIRIMTSPQTTSAGSGPTTARFQIITRADGTKVLTQIPISAPSSSISVPAHATASSSMCVALEGEDGTQFVNISSPSKSGQVS